MGDEHSPVPESARQSTFRKICGLAREHDALLVAGDLFDGALVSDITFEMARTEFAELRARGVEIVLSPGERECGESGGPAEFLSTLGVSHLFSGSGSDSCFTVSREGQTIWIYGAPAGRGDLIRSLRRTHEPGFHAGLFHADFRLREDGDSGSAPILKKSDIRAMGLDFYALGHLHFFKLFKYRNRIIGACAGSPEATSEDETGDRFVLSISVQNDEIYQIKRLAVNSIRLESISFDCAAVKPDEILSRLAQGISPRTILTCTLTGRRDYELDRRVMEKLSRAYHRLIIRDETVPGLRTIIEGYAGEKSLRGEFFRLLGERVSAGGVPEPVDSETLAGTLHDIALTARYTPEDWL